ncbi:hypothetical protein AND_008510 [Anopheles darlingi]|uniref:Uncharacterized protein n=1 Tax=Anopheles darlingi TaxID=43151 RepID=W5J669_ANODA|nr:hypothetical protein AND_008510 [Anopheles darlingi]
MMVDRSTVRTSTAHRTFTIYGDNCFSKTIRCTCGIDDDDDDDNDDEKRLQGIPGQQRRLTGDAKDYDDDDDTRWRAI